MDRFQLYSQLKSNFEKFDDPDIKERLDIMISPLYLFALRCNEGNIEKGFSELTILEKLKIFPSKFLEKIKTEIEYRESSKAERVKAQLPKNRVVFYPVEPTHLNQMIPVSNALPEGSFYYITDRFHIYKELRNQGIACYLLDIPAIHKSYGYDYIALGDGFINQACEAQWKQQCKLYLESRFDALKESLENALEILKPHKLVIGYDITPEGRMAVYLCKNKMIPSICIQHGSIAGEPMDGEHIVENYILYGSKAKDYLVEIGNKQDILKVFGAPYLDAKLGYRSERGHVYQALEIPKQNKIILVALSGPGHCTTFEHFNQIVKSLVEFAKVNSTINLIFKLHRKDNIKNYQPIFNQIGFSCPVIESKSTRFPNDIFFWLNISDILITGSSTVALEAMLKGKPVVTIDYQNQYQNIDFIKLNCTYHVSREALLSQTINIALKQNREDDISINSKRFINEYFYTEKKPASIRIAEWLINVS